MIDGLAVEIQSVFEWNLDPDVIVSKTGIHFAVCDLMGFNGTKNISLLPELLLMLMQTGCVTKP